MFRSPASAPVEHPGGFSTLAAELVPAPCQEVQRYDIARHQRVVRHRRTRALPWKIGGTTTATGYAGWGGGLLAEALSGPLAHLAVTGGTGLTALAALAVLRYRHRDLLKDTDTLWYRRAAAGSTVWATGSAVLGPLWGLGPLLLGAWVRGTSQRWLRPQHPATDPLAADESAVETPEVAGEARPDPAVPSEGDRIRATLGDTVFASGPLDGIELWNQIRLDQGWRWTAQFPQGVTFSSTARCEEMIAGALHTARNRVLWESVPTDVTQAVLTVTTVDLLARGVRYRGPEYHDGRIPLGELADGEGRADAVVADEAGVHCIAFTGDKRKGKSTGQAAVLLGLLESGKWWTVFADGDVTKGSSPVLASRAAWPAAGPERILAQLCALEGILEARQYAMPTLTRENGLVVPMTRSGQERIDKLLPGDAGFPGIMWFFDEFHRLVNDPMLLDANFPARLLTWLLLGAKYGMGGCAAAHSVHRSHWHTTDLFAAFAGRNHFAHYAHNNSEYVQAGEERMSLNGLPAAGGYFLAPSTGRLVMGRTAHPLSVGDRVFTHPELHELDKKGAGEWLPTGDHDPHADYREAFEALAAWERDVETRRGGENEEIEEDYSGYGDTVTPLFRPAAAEPAPPVLEVPGDLNPTRAAILAALRDLGTAGNRELHRKVPGVSPSSMTKHLDYLAEQGLARKARHGTWEPAGTHRTRTGS